jgi:hypothetical protein
MLLGDCADEAALHEIVGACRVPGERASIAAQPWDLSFEKSGKIAHRHHLRGSSLGRAEAARSEKYSFRL